MSEDFVFRGRVADVDPELHDLFERERVRQEKTVILIPSESMAPDAVEEAMGSKFGNIYAEGYPRESSRKQTEEEILDVEKELALYRRNSDPRYYKGVEYADVLEALARRRAAELFAANGVTADQLYVNVQTLSGGPANSALYSAVLKPGDTIMGLKLADGGHLSHGAPVNRSGSIYKSISYIVDAETERFDYEAIEKMALEIQPDLIVAGFSAYPLVIDWQRFRVIADKVGAHLHADIAHISGLVAAGVHPSPIGVADSVMTTTHKSLCGPRGAMLLTHRADIGRKIDKAVFPGEQGGGHFNTIGALAVALKLALTPQFKSLQHQIVANASRLAQKLQEHGLRVVAGKSENHLLLIDCTTVKNENGVGLDGDSAARILDVAGIVTNRNTIPGDRSALTPSGVRIGTVWITQLGFKEKEIDQLAEAIAVLLNNSVPVEYPGRIRRRTRRAKVAYHALKRARELVRQMTKQPVETAESEAHTLQVRGNVAQAFLDGALTTDVNMLNIGESGSSAVIVDENATYPLTIERAAADRYLLRAADGAAAAAVKLWLQDLSDGYVFIDDPYIKLPGPVTVEHVTDADLPIPAVDAVINHEKLFFVGQSSVNSSEERTSKPEFAWQEPAQSELRRTHLYHTHVASGAKMVDFAGYDMPVWYSSVGEEHAAVRNGAALFDVSHMGVFSSSGSQAHSFLNAVTANDLTRLGVGKSMYTYLLDPAGGVIDDLMIYRMGTQEFILVVNASNLEKDWAWLNAVNNREVRIDPSRPWLTMPYTCDLKDLRKSDERTIIALQGPKAGVVLAEALGEPFAAAAKMKWATQSQIEGFIVSRTGYTGEKMAFELLVPADQLVTTWEKLIAAGATPAGLAARDSTRTEAGLPLYGHELAGKHNIDPDTATFGQYIKPWKPFFIGRKGYLKQYETHQNTIVRFTMDDKGVRRPVQGDPIIDKRGKVVGVVTSCAIDSDGSLTGMALVPMSYRKPGSPMFIYQLGGGVKPVKGPAEIKVGSRLPKPDTATVRKRFM